VHNTSAARILRPDQVIALPEPRQIITDPVVIRDVIGKALLATGGHRTPTGGFLQYLRRGGGAGFLGVTRDVMTQLDTVVANVQTKGGGVLTIVDLDLVSPRAIWDLSDPTIMRRMMRAYPRFRKMYQLMQSEGVVAVRSRVPASAVQALVNIPPDATEADMRNIARDLGTSCAI
jgi:hypothetical protein